VSRCPCSDVYVCSRRWYVNSACEAAVVTMSRAHTCGHCLGMARLPLYLGRTKQVQPTSGMTPWDNPLPALLSCQGCCRQTLLTAPGIPRFAPAVSAQHLVMVHRPCAHRPGSMLPLRLQWTLVAVKSSAHPRGHRRFVTPILHLSCAIPFKAGPQCRGRRAPGLGQSASPSVGPAAWGWRAARPGPGPGRAPPPVPERGHDLTLSWKRPTDWHPQAWRQAAHGHGGPPTRTVPSPKRRTAVASAPRQNPAHGRRQRSTG
jgi:hypothetical protein